MEPPQRSDDSRIQVQEAARLHWYVSYPQQSPPWPQNGWSHGCRASQDQEARGGLLHPIHDAVHMFDGTHGLLFFYLLMCVSGMWHLVALTDELHCMC